MEDRDDEQVELGRVARVRVAGVLARALAAAGAGVCWRVDREWLAEELRGQKGLAQGRRGRDKLGQSMTRYELRRAICARARSTRPREMEGRTVQNCSSWGSQAQEGGRRQRGRRQGCMRPSGRRANTNLVSDGAVADEQDGPAPEPADVLERALAPLAPEPLLASAGVVAAGLEPLDERVRVADAVCVPRGAHELGRRAAGRERVVAVALGHGRVGRQVPVGVVRVAAAVGC